MNIWVSIALLLSYAFVLTTATRILWCSGNRMLAIANALTGFVGAITVSFGP